MNARAYRISPIRRGLLLALLAGLAGAVLWRAFELQVLKREFLQNQGDARYLRVVSVAAHRGMVTDRHGEPLAISAPVEAIWAHPGELATAPERWRELAEALGLRREQIEQLVAGRADKEFVYLRRQVDPALAQRVMALRVPGVALQREYRRYYPAGEVAAHVVGFTNVDDRGQEGVELAYDRWLRGTPGAQRVIKDRLGRVVEGVESLRQPSPGKDLALSIDRRIQYLAYRELKAAVQRHQASAGSAVVLDVKTGEIIAMVNQPSYNPNNRGGVKGDRLRNRAVTDLFEPGSTIKPFAVAAALESGLYKPGTMIDTAPGYYAVASRVIRDIHNYGLIDVSTVIQKSSNIGVTKMVMDIEPKLFWQTLASVGFGNTSGARFPGEVSGQLPHFTDWRQIDRATLAFGYGLSVTPLQLAQAYAALASDGRMHPVSFRRGGDPEAMVLAEDPTLSPTTLAQVRQMLEAVVAPGGTGGRARVPGYRVAGKTGTIKKLGAQGYTEDEYLGLFAGLAPGSDPRLAMVVVIDNPRGGGYYGGEVAAPVFGRVMAGALRLLDVPPDDLQAIEARMAMLGGGVR